MQRRIAAGLMFALALGGFPSSVHADEKQGGLELVRSIHAAWKGRQAQFKSLTCTAKVDSFFPKGYVTNTRAAWDDLDPAKIRPCPEKDTEVTGESVSWDMDFVNQRFRKEQDLTEDCRFAVGQYDLVRMYNLFLAANGKSMIFRPKDRYPKKMQELGVLPIDATLYEQQANPFVITFDDMPLLWAAGGVTGEMADSERLQRLDDSSRFSYRGEAEWKGHKCAILVIQEQKSPTAVREFWVDLANPYLIRLCRIRDAENVLTQFEVEYKEDSEFSFLPKSWTLTYNHRGNPALFLTRTYRVEKLTVNASIPGSHFEQKLEPGMIVSSPSQGKDFEVQADGSLGPLSSYNPNKGGVWRWLGIVLGAFLAGVAVVLYIRKRKLRTG